MGINPGTIIERYEIRSLLGAGGMGEVYEAFDTRLERSVALKFLKQSDDAEKLRRFRQEAKAVSALNHPNILTIYEVGNYADYHFIVSELVVGKNLRDVITNEKLTLAEILDIAVQIGNALAAAHHVGIVHRDIKPENIMILPDGYVKVLDFGLAKLIGLEKNFAPDSDLPTASLIETKAGMILGTVNYMSPEQLRGKTIDERTDIWSLGVVLFEMLARRRPFTGESVSDVIAAVLERALPQISELDADIPPEIETIVNKALEKNKENRFPTVRAFVSDLKNAKSISANGSYSFAVGKTPTDSFHSQKTLLTDANRTAVSTDNLSGVFIGGRKLHWRVIAASAFLLMLATGFTGWFYIYRPLALVKPQPPLKQIQSQRLSTTGDIVNAALSPDGNFVVYVRNNDGRQSLWLRQIYETAGQKLISATAESYAGLTFNSAGTWIYYTVFNRDGIGKLNRIPLLGGTPQEIAKDVDSPICFAPDGKTFAFIRSNPGEGVDRIIVSNADGSGERVLSEKKRPEFYKISTRESLAWSPDGKYIASPLGQVAPDGEFMSVAEINVETGEQRIVTDAKWHRVGRIQWTKNADELLITAAEFGSELFQIRKIFRSSGLAQNVTGELNDYYSLSLNENSTRLLSVAYDKTSNLYTASSEQPTNVKLLAGGNYDGIGGVLWTNGGRIIYVSAQSGNRDIWARDADGDGNPQQLTFERAADDFPSISDDGRQIVFVSSRTGVPHIWRMNQNGGESKQLTDQGGESLPDITPDGNYVVYSRAKNRSVLWKIPAAGGEPEQLTREQTSGSAISPDGKFIACLTRGSTLESPLLLALVDFQTGAIVKTFKPPGVVSAPGLPATIRWLPGGQKFSYVADINDISNIWTQAVTGGEPKKITDFAADKILSFDWSKDGKRIVYARGKFGNDLVLIENF